jgi:acyl carrier protein
MRVPTNDEIQADVIALIAETARDWEYGGEISSATRLFADLGFESLDAVILGTAIQERYKRAMPFAELLASIGSSGSDLSVAQLVTFIRTHLHPAAERVS